MNIDDLYKTNPDRTKKVEPPQEIQPEIKEEKRQCPEYKAGKARKEMFFGVENVMCDLPECPYGYNSQGFLEDEENTFNICTVRGYIGKNLDVKV